MLATRLHGLRTLALLGFALVGPAALPAGGAERRVPEVRRRQQWRDPITAPARIALHCAPQRRAPVIHQVYSGQPLRVMRRWWGDDGRCWLQVEASSRRGWLVEAET
jgi:hypothetical protein